MATHQGPAPQHPAKDVLQFTGRQWLTIVFLGSIGIATYWAIVYGVYRFAAASFG